MAALLEIEAVAHTGRMRQEHLDLASVPLCDVLRAVQSPGLGDRCPDSVQVVLVAVKYQNRAVGGVDNLQQRLQLCIMQPDDIALVGVDAAVGNL